MSDHMTNESQIKVVRGSGNIFADLGVANAEEELAKAELAFSIRQRIKAKGLNQTDAATLLGTDQAKISLLMNGKVGGFTFDRLVRFLNALEMDVKISISPTTDQERGKTLVMTP